MTAFHCNLCNSPLNENNKFCPHCGTPVSIQKTKDLCPTCNHRNPAEESFCEKCGTPLKTNLSNNQVSEKNTKKKFISKGSYSGKMVKGKTSKGWKIFRNTIIGIVLLGIIALIIWFQTDPEAGKKLTDVSMGVGFMIVFFFFGWLFMRGKKGRKSGWDDDHYTNVNDNDFDNDGDDDD
ncbi:MAG TPA: zinc ribbon domain-containing protein [Mariniphaga anaerophila]|uniref:Zinc ribbon domain-containing protein n=1 Tax=Mariniphaga anaerophila TaxID=1484053 RepID=A0A831LJP7_9BACT|nr:zinc ribbon domain-containing protein [Mariniphaga anaerophila]